MKKFFGLICVLGLLSLPVMAQDSAPHPVSFTWQYQAGIALTITPAAIDFGVIPLLTDPLLVEDWYPCPSPSQIVISYKLATGHRPQLVCETLTDLLYNTEVKDYSGFLHHEVTGDIVVPEVALPNVGDPAQVMWTGDWNGGKDIGDMLWKVRQHEEYGGTEHAFVGEAVYTVMDVII